MRCCPSAVAAITLALALLPAAAGAQPGAVSLEVSSPWGITGWPVPIQIRAQSDRAREVTLELACASATATARLALPAGLQVRRTFLVPQLDWQSYGCVPSVRWRGDDGLTGEARGVLGRNDLDVVVVEPLALDDHRRASSIAPELLPDRWQAYPPGAIVLVDAAGTSRLTPTQRDALATWTRAGGDLVVVGAPALVDAWRERGAVLRMSGEDTRTMTAVIADEPRGLDDVLSSPRVPGTEELPVAGFLAVAVLFALLAGPVNLGWVLRRGRRHLFLVTTPLLSLAACALLIGYNLVSEGLGAKRAAVQLTWLDTQRAEALTWHGVTYFAGSGVGRFDLPSDARVIATGGETITRYDAAPPRRHIAWGPTGQTLEGEWIPTRLNTHLAFLVPASERRRLRLQRPDRDAAPVLDNGLGVTLTGLAWRDEDNAGWQLPGPLAPGERAALVRGGESRYPDTPPLFGPGAARVLPRALAPGHFIAELDEPFTPLLGPDAEDVVAALVWIAGPLVAEASPGTPRAPSALPAPPAEVSP